MTSPRPDLVPVMDVGGTHVTAALFDPATGLLVEASRHRRSLDASAPREDIVSRLSACASDLAAPPGATWGIAVPGPFDYREGIGRYHDVGKLEALNGVDLGHALRQGIRSAPAAVRFLNDASAFGIGERTPAGAAAGRERVLALTLGTGVGSAFLDRGQVVEDDAGVPPEGRVDLLEIDGRPLEESVSRRAILARYADLTAADPTRAGRIGADPAYAERTDADRIGAGDVDVAVIAQRATEGEEVAHRVLHDAFHTLGLALRPWVESFAVDIVVIGGSVAGSWNLVSEPLRAALGGPAVVPARLGDDAALVGAGTYVRKDA